MNIDKIENRALPETVPADLQVRMPVLVHRDPDGVLWAEVPALPGCVAGGDEVDEVLANLRDAAEGWLLAKHDIETKGWPRIEPPERAPLEARAEG